MPVRSWYVSKTTLMFINVHLKVHQYTVCRLCVEQMAFLDERGLWNKASHVSSRTAYLFSRFVKSVNKYEAFFMRLTQRHF